MQLHMRRILDYLVLDSRESSCQCKQRVGIAPTLFFVLCRTFVEEMCEHTAVQLYHY